jgi:hypothetical protein
MLTVQASYCTSPRAIRLSQDGDDEGCLHLDRLPTPSEAGSIREAIRIRQRRHMTVEGLSALERARATIKTPHQPQAFV